MLQKLKKLLANEVPAKSKGGDEEQLAVAVLLFEAAASDGVIEDSEESHIQTLLQNHYELDAGALEDLCGRAAKIQGEAVELSRFTRSIKEHLDFDERIDLMEMLWGVIYADGVVDDYEANLMRRLGGLIYVDDRAIGEARKRIEAKQKQ